MTVTMDPAVPRDDRLIWSSSDPSVATVDENGLVTGVSEGTVTITAQAVDGGATATRELTIKKVIPLTGIEFDSSEMSVYKGKYLDIPVNYIPENATYKSDVTWTSSDPDVADVQEKSGKVYGKKPGKTTITFSTESGLTATCVVTVLEEEKADLKDASVSFDQYKFTYTGSIIVPEITVTYDGELLLYGLDYLVEFTDNIEIGTAYAKIKGIGGYTGSVTKTFRIMPGKVTVKYDRTTSGDSYVLQYCERQDMVGAKTKVVLGAANTSYVIGGLKKGKTYYISIRVRKKVSGIDYYTTFGVAKKVKITK